MEIIAIYITFFIVSYSIPLFLQILLSIRSIKKENTKDFVNYIILMILEVLILSYLIFLFIAMDDQNDAFMPFYFSIISYSALIAWILIIIFSVLHHFIQHAKPSQIKEEIVVEDANKLRLDLKRKINHILLCVLLWIGILIINIFLVFPPEWTQQEFLARVWEYSPEDKLLIFTFFNNSSNIYKMGLYHAFFIIVFATASYLITIFELIRHFKWFILPTSKVINKILRAKEIDGISSFYNFIIAITLTFFILPPLLTISIANVCLIGDLAASQIGIRFGKHKIRINNNKSWEGTISSTIIGFLISTILIGPLYSGVAAIIFAVTDILTEKKVPLSDNLLNPLLMMILFLLVNLSGFYYSFPNFLL